MLNADLFEGGLLIKKEKKTILIIDDDRTTFRLLEKWFQNDGYNVIGAGAGQDGLEAARVNQPDGIVLDLMIPDMNGVQVAKQLRQDPTTDCIPIVFISMTIGVENDKGDEKIEIDGDFFHVFAKPLHSRKLLSTMRKQINKKENENK